MYADLLTFDWSLTELLTTSPASIKSTLEDAARGSSLQALGICSGGDGVSFEELGVTSAWGFRVGLAVLYPAQRGRPVAPVLPAEIREGLASSDKLQRVRAELDARRIEPAMAARRRGLEELAVAKTSLEAAGRRTVTLQAMPAWRRSDVAEGWTRELAYRIAYLESFAADEQSALREPPVDGSIPEEVTWNTFARALHVARKLWGLGRDEEAGEWTRFVETAATELGEGELPHVRAALSGLLSELDVDDSRRLPAVASWGTWSGQTDESIT